MRINVFVATAFVALAASAARAQSVDVLASGRFSTLELTGDLQPLGSFAAGCWGAADYGECNVPNVPLDTIAKLAAGLHHVVMLRTDGTLLAWGDNSYGQLNTPAGTFADIAAAEYHSLAIRSDGTLAGWGYNGSGQINVPAGTFTAVACGGYHSLGLRSDGTLAAWGHNYYGQCDVPGGTFSAVAAGTFFSAAIRTDGTLAAWGLSNQGQTDVPPGAFLALSANADFAVAIRTDGTLAGWGQNLVGQTEVPPGQFAAVYAGQFHGVAQRADGTLVGWGWNGYGQLDFPNTAAFSAFAAGQFCTLGVHSIQITTPPALALTYDSAVKPGSDRWTISSDRRLKANIQTLTGALDRLLALRGVTFRWRDAASQGGRTGVEMGLIADEVERVFPQWIGRDARGYRTLTVSGFDALTAEALRDLRAEKDRVLAAQDAELAGLRKDAQQLEAALAAQRSQAAQK